MQYSILSKKRPFWLLSTIVLTTILIIGCSKKEDNKPGSSSTSSTSSTNSTANSSSTSSTATTNSTATTSSTSSTATTNSTATTSSTSSTATTSSSSSTSSTGNANNEVSVDGTTYPLTVTCGASTNYMVTGMNNSNSVYCSVSFDSQPTAAGTYSVGATTGPMTCALLFSDNSDSYLGVSGTVTVSINNGKVHVTFNNVSIENGDQSITKVISGSFGCN